MTAELRIGLTTLNDAESLELCLESIRRTAGGIEHEVVVVDAGSQDGTPERARAAGALVVEHPWSQADGLNFLLATSRSPYTLLLHSDVTLLADDWYESVKGALDDRIALVAPEDTGLGPHLRAAYGAGQPESSFLFWRTAAAHRLRTVDVRRLARAVRRRQPLRAIDLDNRHVTHRLPELLRARGLDWLALDVLVSPRGERWYEFEGDTAAAVWDPAWGELEYGFGNFYALGETITHFHQWYSRYALLEPNALNDDGVPAVYLRRAAERFRRDYRAGTVKRP